MSVFAPKMSGLVRRIGKAVLDRYDGKFATQQYFDDIYSELQKEDLNHPDFRVDIVRHFVREDLGRRARIDPIVIDEHGIVQPHLFNPHTFAATAIRLGNGFNVRGCDATVEAFLARQHHQQLAAESAQRAATRTTAFLRTSEPGRLLVSHPTMRMSEAMYSLRLWSPDDPLTDTTDDDEADADD